MKELAKEREWTEGGAGVAGRESRAAEGSRAAVRPLRVLLVAPSLGILGGQAVQAARLLERLGREPEIEISFLPVNPRLPGALSRLQDIKYVRTLVTSAAYAASLVARVPRYDVLHVFSASYLSFVLAPTPAILAAKLFGKRVVLNYRSGQCEDHLTRWRRTALPTLRLADAVAVPSGYLVEVFARFGVRARAVHNIVETERFRFRERRPLSPVFLSNRNLEPLYNVACTLRAFALVQQRFPQARLTVAGDGPQRGELESLARTLSLRGVEFVGRVEHARMPALYEAADVYLNSPDIDNMPGSILEAYAAGLPVVTTDAGGIPHIVRHEETGMMAARGDHEALAACAIRLLEDEELASRVARAARAECAKYSWESVRGEWLRLYREVAGREAQED